MICLQLQPLSPDKFDYFDLSCVLKLCGFDSARLDTFGDESCGGRHAEVEGLKATSWPGRLDWRKLEDGRSLAYAICNLCIG